MKNFVLNSSQISKLIKNNYIEIKNNEIIELSDNNFILNINGNTSKISTLKMEFEELKLKNEHIIKFIRELVCEHLNLTNQEVIFIDSTGEEFDFIIHFAPKVEWKLIVCESRQAILNMQAIDDDFSNNISEQPSYIGLYKKLGNSAYYYRWIKDV
jgi:hypothetical protein